ncbi:hypothetical protein L3Y34_013799 [Caenorhabditis briggsae]|uniref:SCP domain-containing protein n=1 Tax=Caenorhabditis briggsae TaxID=6238 RepID=A0AAE8ZW03_CAEBR|nr:hypothetical protein L3Y34_013799 [Caenorhabditis briggsae]
MKILLLFSAFAVAVNAVQWSELDFYNMLRRDFAKTNAIPDMWKLTWDKKLEVLANKFDCNDKAVRKNYRYFLTDGSPRNESKIVDADTLNWMIETEKTNPAELTNTVKEWEKTTARFFEYVNNIQTKMACGFPLPHCKRNFGIMGDIVYKRVCLFGPHTKLGFYPPVDQHSGKIPGSQCGPNGKNDDGLCVPK